MVLSGSYDPLCDYSRRPPNIYVTNPVYARLHALKPKRIATVSAAVGSILDNLVKKVHELPMYYSLCMTESIDYLP